MSMTVYTFFLNVNGTRAESVSNSVGNISVPSGVVMRSFSTSQPNYLKGDCIVRITTMPKSAFNVIRYVWIEDLQKGLKPTVDKLQAVPAVVFDDVDRDDAKRIVANLKSLGCMAEYTISKKTK